MKGDRMSRVFTMFKRCLFDKQTRFGYLSRMGLFNGMSDSTYIRKEYKINMGKELNLEQPKTFNEKLQWLKLYDRKEIYTKMVDKYEVKEYVKNIIGEEYIIPTLGVWGKVEDIDFDSLPNQFVLKVTHDSGGLVICKDKLNFDVKNAKKILKKSLKRNYYLEHREWPYKDVPRRIIAEEYLEDESTSELRDYKFYAFDGYVKTMLLATNRQSLDKELTFDYFDREGNHLKLKNYWHPNSGVTPQLPSKFKDMINLAECLSKGIPHIRVDFYEVNGKIYFGELTFFDMGGYLKLEPTQWEREWGNLIKLTDMCS